MVDYELNELRREFLDEAREKVLEMRGALAGAEEPEARERLAYLAHQLKGSGGSYGYQKISEDAAEIERGIESWNPDEAGALDRLVTRLLESIDSAVGELV